MPTDDVCPPSHSGARIRLSGRGAEMLPPARPPSDGMLPAEFSILSPGTERRHLSAGVREAGYMSLSHSPTGDWTLAPTPHGAAFDPAHKDALTAPGRHAMAALALARFQMMALLGLDRVPTRLLTDSPVVVGSGPVGLGCALELARRGSRDIRVVTNRPRPPVALAPGVRCVAATDVRDAALVVDAVGHPSAAARLLGRCGTLGLLGTPDESASVEALQAHRCGWSVAGMHELLAPAGVRQDAFTTAAAWLSEVLDARLTEAWVRTVPGEEAPGVYASLGTGARAQEPVIAFDWVS